MTATVPIYGLPEVESAIVNSVMGALAAASLVYCLVAAARERRTYPVYLFVGSALAVWYEVLTDVLGHVAWATQGEIVIVRALGRELPLYANFVYMFYFPVALVSLDRALGRGVTWERWRRWALAGIPLTLLFELYPIHRQWWVYYGDNQPLPVLGFPLYWAFVNSMSILCVAALNWLLRTRVLGERHAWLLMVSVPLSLVCIHMPVVFPVQMVLGSTESLEATTAASLLTMALALAMLVLVGKAATTRSPENHRPG
jgi:hypothetical protein